MIRQALPWWARVGAKMVLARLPIPYAVWRGLRLFRHGEMDRPEYALQVVSQHLERAGFQGRSGFAALEIGPGDSLASMIVAKALGASSCEIVDVAPAARTDLKPYLALCRFLEERGFQTAELRRARSLEDLMNRCNARYLTDGVEGLRRIASETIDAAWSHAVLEHVKRSEFPDLMKEVRRVLRPEGVASHTIDLSDHMGGALNQLRFSEAFWEGGTPFRSGFYTNRLRYSEMLRLFEECGFAVEVTAASHWERLPTPRSALRPPYDSMAEEELRISGFDVRLRPRNPRSERR